MKFGLAMFCEECFEDILEFNSAEERDGFERGAGYASSKYGGGSCIGLCLPLTKEDEEEYSYMEDWKHFKQLESKRKQ